MPRDDIKRILAESQKTLEAEFEAKKESVRNDLAGFKKKTLERI